MSGCVRPISYPASVLCLIPVSFSISLWVNPAFSLAFFNLLSNLTFELYGYQVNFLAIVFVLFIVGFMITAFWKGSKT